MENSSKSFSEKIKAIKVFKDQGRLNFIDRIPHEILLSIFLNGNLASTISCSPKNLIELTVGYLINNGYILNYSDINLIKICSYDLGKIIKKKK